MAVKTYMDLIDEMKALADKINNHYDNPEIHRWAPGGRENLTLDGKLP